MQYAQWTQRGYYPDDPHKENQDEYRVQNPFTNSDRDAMLAVYDGHGKQGHACARYAKKHLGKCVEKQVRLARVKKYKDELRAAGSPESKVFDPHKWPYLNADEYKVCCEKAFAECNQQMHASPDVSSISSDDRRLKLETHSRAQRQANDKLSGTTAITVHFHGNQMIVCNVGDSRAVLGHWVSDGTGNPDEEEKTEIGNEAPERPRQNDRNKTFPSQGGKMLAIPLSLDQTPYRQDERERVKKAGAAVMSIDQMEGKEEIHEHWGDMVLGEDLDIHGDPPRIWIPGEKYPGTAFTRSLGDRLAKDIGVTAEPEILAKQLTLNDHILIVASDGIFEFITNQEAIDMCLACDSPLHACEALVKAAYDQWLTYENRTDDITLIVCFLSVEKPVPENGEEGTTEDLVALASTMYGEKPHRKRANSVFKSDL